MTEDGIILDADASLQLMLGYDGEGLRGCHFESILTRASSIFLHLQFQARMKLDGKIENMHLILRKADGGSIPCLLHAHVRERNGAFVHACSLTTAEAI